MLVGLTDRLVGGRELSPERRAQLDAVMRQETLALRQLVRQFVDYTRLKTDRDLDSHGAGRRRRDRSARRWRPRPSRMICPPVAADVDRLHQMLTSLATDVVRETQPPRAGAHRRDRRRRRRPGPHHVTGPAPPRDDPFDGGRHGRARPLRHGRAGRLRLGGAVALAPTAEGGSAYTLSLRRAG